MIRYGRAASPAQTVLQALWNLRLLGLFVVAPAVGVLLADAIFSMPVFLLWVAGGFLLFSLVLLGVLVRAECQRLSRATGAAEVGNC